MTRTMRIQMIDMQNKDSSDEDARFAKLNKIAGKYKKEGTLINSLLFCRKLLEVQVSNARKGK